MMAQVQEVELDVSEAVDLHDFKIYNIFQSFIRAHTMNSKRTASEYKSRITEFFHIILNKPVQLVKEEDVLNIERLDIQNYISKLLKNGNSKGTIKTKLNSVSSFYSEMMKNKVLLNPSILRVSMKTTTKHHDSLSFHELDNLYEFMRSEKELSLEKRLVTKFFATTANRKSVTFNMTWDDITQKTDVVTGRKVWVATVIAKGEKESEKPISDEFYEELQQLNSGQDKVFSLSPRTYERALERFSKQLGRKVTIHGLKATAVTLGYQMTKDINLCKQLADHEDISTTGIYLKEEKSYTNQLSYNMSRKLDDSILKDMSKEDLMKFLEDNEDIKNSILMRLGV
ncbi:MULTISPECIES: tyrosine-type recombinase/integrase [Bacillus cereus group]|uniref:tyrosine-type recombinase/integrase n=1 Tax=Bacillus cereus group TaxID=86661 RepID=UPI000BF9F9AD|nr:MULTISPECIES: site-specific integrase [Bacillus cereus group]PGA25406.1 hypothetical protein COL80_16140 [Bacillus thuringiensis]PGU82174.1 hypothetical protein COD76_11855 [Bacillus cereus]